MSRWLQSLKAANTIRHLWAMKSSNSLPLCAVGFSTDLARVVLGDLAAQQALVDQARGQAAGARGVDVHLLGDVADGDVAARGAANSGGQTGHRRQRLELGLLEIGVERARMRLPISPLMTMRRRQAKTEASMPIRACGHIARQADRLGMVGKCDRNRRAGPWHPWGRGCDLGRFSNMAALSGKMCHCQLYAISNNMPLTYKSAWTIPLPAVSPAAFNLEPCIVGNHHEDHGTPRSVGVVIASVAVLLLLASLDQTIVGTALPTIVADLGGIDHLSWVVTAYLLVLDCRRADLRQARRPLRASHRRYFLDPAVPVRLCAQRHGPIHAVPHHRPHHPGFGGGGLFVLALSIIGDVIPPASAARSRACSPPCSRCRALPGRCSAAGSSTT